MITHDQVPSVTPSIRNIAEQRAIEEHFDSHLAKDIFLVLKVRSGWAEHNINAVIERYRAVGWKVTGNGPWQFSK